jgi:uncharacterized protein YndB with AHSA1/START domain
MRPPRTIDSIDRPAIRAGSVRLTRQIKAAPERVFDAWLDADEASAFLFGDPLSDPISSQIDGQVGGRFRIVRRRAGKSVEYSGEYVEIDRPYRLVFSLFVEAHAQRDDRVVVELAPVAKESLLVLTHEYSLPSPTKRARLQDEWETTLGELAASCGESATYLPLPWLRAPGLAGWEA